MEKIKDVILEFIKKEFIENTRCPSDHNIENATGPFCSNCGREWVANPEPTVTYDIHIDYDTPLISNGIVDSFSMVALKLFLEREYSISIPDELADTKIFDTVNNIAKMLEQFGIKN